MNHVKKHANLNAVQFVKNASIDIEKALTQEIQLILKQQLNFKKETWTVINKCDDSRDRMITAELMNA